MPTAEEVARGATRGTSKNNSNRGSTDNAKRLAAFANRKATGSADWGGCDPEWIAACVVAITRLGGAVTFGTSRDGGAYSLTLLLDAERQTLWFNGDADLDTELEGVHATLDALD